MKVPVAVLGATGLIGQKLVTLLANHPWFEIEALCASDNSLDRPYSDFVDNAPSAVSCIKMRSCHSDLSSPIIFSALNSDIAGDIELKLAQNGHWVISNAKNHRMLPHIPLVIPEVNSDHIELLNSSDLKIITNPNCTTTGLALALKPINDKFGLESVNVVSLQSVSGAGKSSQLDIDDNVLPFIEEEEIKIETETLKLLGKINGTGIKSALISLSAQCNRVPVSEGHLLCVSVKLRQMTKVSDLIDAWNSFKGHEISRTLPSYQKNVIIYSDDPYYPQPKKHRNHGQGMSVSIGRLRPCENFDFKFTLLVHNMIRGGAGGSLLNAELVKSLNNL